MGIFNVGSLSNYQTMVNAAPANVKANKEKASVKVLRKRVFRVQYLCCARK